MMYSMLLIVHIIGASLTIILAGYVSAMLWNNMQDRYRLCAIALSALLGFDMLSGVLLSVLSSSVSALSLCANFALYLSVVLTLETILFARMRKEGTAFPLINVFSPIAAGLAASITALSLGL